MASLIQNNEEFSTYWDRCHDELKIGNFKRLQKGPEENTTLSHNIGSFDLCIYPRPMIIKKMTILLNLDRSGSMSEKVKGTTLLEYAQHTIKNMIDFMVTDEEYSKIQIDLVINYFDQENKTIVMENEEGDLSSIITLTQEKSKALIEKIKQIEPRGTTNISGACEKISQIREQIDGPCLHILFTDGIPNNGHTTFGAIGDRIPKNCDNVFFGFGVDHCEKLLSDIATYVNGDYAFVDNIENAGMVYGEYLCNSMKKIVKNVMVTVENGEVYSNGEWTNEIKYRSLASGMIKQIFMRHPWIATADEPFIFNLTYENMSGEKRVRKGKIDRYDVTKPMKKEDRNPIVWKEHKAVKVMDTLNKVLNNRDQITIENLVQMLDEFKAYMEANNLNDDLLMIGLCDDLIIATKMYNCPRGNILIKARLNALTHQLSYQPNNCELFENDRYGNPNRLRGGPGTVRYLSSMNYDSDSDSDDNIPIRRGMLSASNSGGFTFRRASVGTARNGGGGSNDSGNFRRDERDTLPGIFMPRPQPVLEHQLSTNSQSAFTTPSQQRIQRSLSLPH